jgi:hypothetical protein
MVYSPGSIEKLSDFHLFLGIGSSLRPRGDINHETSQTSRIIIADGVVIAKADDPIQIEFFRDFSPSLLGFSRIYGKTAIEAFDEGREKGIGFLKGGNAGQSEFCSEAVLKDTKESLHSSFGLRREGINGSNPKGLQS